MFSSRKRVDQVARRVENEMLEVRRGVRSRERQSEIAGESGVRETRSVHVLSNNVDSEPPQPQSSCSSLHVVVGPNTKPSYVPPHVVDLGSESSFRLLNSLLAKDELIELEVFT